MSELALSAQTRTLLGKGVKALRQEGKIPAILYGSKTKTRPLQVDYIVFEKLYKKAGESSLVDLSIDGKKPLKVIIHDVQRDPVTDSFEHVDFYQVDLKRKITTEIVLNFVGEAPAVKELGGVLVRSLDHVKVECLPEDLVHEITIDLSPLKSFEDIIYVKDLSLPDELTLLEKPDETVALVKPPRSEAELKELEEKAEEKIEEIEQVKKKEEEAAEEAPAEETDHPDQAKDISS